MADEIYTHGHDPAVLRAHRWRTAANSAAYLLEHLRPGLDLLDVGCGPGTITTDLARAVRPGRVVGVDRSESVVADARAAVEVASANVDVDVEFAVGDAYRLDHSDDSFDVVHGHQVLQHLADPVGALREWRRVCRPGGVVAARDADYAGMCWWPPEPALDRWLQLYRSAARANGGEPDAGRRLRSWARSAGFAEVTASASAWCFTDPEDRQWWADTWAARISDSALSRQIVDQERADRAELSDVADGWRRWGTAADGWFVVVHGEVLCTVPA